jgi:pilus assembly protein Flp/PilA
MYSLRCIAGCRWEASFRVTVFNGVQGMKNLLLKLQRDEDGAAMVEYAVILGLITAAVIATITTIGTNVGTILTKVNSALATAAG